MGSISIAVGVGFLWLPSWTEEMLASLGERHGGDGRAHVWAENGL